MASEKFPFSIVDELDLPWGALTDEHVETRKGGERRRCVFEYEGRFWSVAYTQTEIDGIYWSHYDRRPSHIECTEVEPHIVEVTQWVEKA